MTLLASATVRVLLIWVALAIALYFMVRFAFNLVVDLFDTP